MTSQDELKSRTLEYLKEKIDAQENIIRHAQALLNQLHIAYERVYMDIPADRHAMLDKPHLTKEFVLNTLKTLDKPLQTVEIVDMYLQGLTPEERGKQVKSVSVMLNLLEKEGLITAERVKGVKGNYYSYKK